MTPLALIVLALLCERPMHQYEMVQLLLKRREDRLVKIRPGTLYHTVARLAEDELVEPAGIEREGGRPERTTYRITPAGAAAMRERIRELVATPGNEFPQFPVALGEAHNLRRADMIELVRARMAVIEAKLAHSRDELVEALACTDEVYLLAWQYLIAMADAELSWLRALIARMESKELEWVQEDRL